MIYRLLVASSTKFGIYLLRKKFNINKIRRLQILLSLYYTTTGYIITDARVNK